MEIRGDLRDVEDDLREHNAQGGCSQPLSCSRIQMHIIELESYIDEMDDPVRLQIVIILLNVAMHVSGRHRNAEWYGKYATPTIVFPDTGKR